MPRPGSDGEAMKSLWTRADPPHPATSPRDARSLPALVPRLPTAFGDTWTASGDTWTASEQESLIDQRLPRDITHSQLVAYG